MSSSLASGCFLSVLLLRTWISCYLCMFIWSAVVYSLCLCVPPLCVPNIILAFICSAMSDTMIMDAIASHLVLPNRLTVPLVADLHVAQLRSPLPRVTVSIMNGLEKHGPTQTKADLPWHISCKQTHSLKVTQQIHIANAVKIMDPCFVRS